MSHDIIIATTMWLQCREIFLWLAHPKCNCEHIPLLQCRGSGTRIMATIHDAQCVIVSWSHGTSFLLVANAGRQHSRHIKKGRRRQPRIKSFRGQPKKSRRKSIRGQPKKEGFKAYDGCQKKAVDWLRRWSLARTSELPEVWTDGMGCSLFQLSFFDKRRSIHKKNSVRKKHRVNLWLKTMICYRLVEKWWFVYIN
jgi:hypothetical protein